MLGKEAFDFMCRHTTEKLTTSHSKQADFVENVKFHLPRVRRLDSLLGAGLGAIAGLGVAGIRDLVSDDNEEDKKRYVRYSLLGALGGLGAANITGDRLRRYLTNKLPMYGYDVDKTTQVLMPTSWQDFYDAAIADKRNIRSRNPAPHIRRELTRRSMNLPPVSLGETAYLQDIGKRHYQPTIDSGGLPGKFKHVAFSPEGWKRYKREMATYVKDKSPLDITANAAARIGPINSEVIGGSDYGSGAADLFARHGYRWNDDGSVNMHDLWDFALSPEEKREAFKLLQDPFNLKATLPIETIKKTGFGWLNKLDMEEKHKGSRLEWLKSLLARQLMHGVTNGGVVFDQRFTPNGSPVFP